MKPFKAKLASPRLCGSGMKFVNRRANGTPLLGWRKQGRTRSIALRGA